MCNKNTLKCGVRFRPDKLLSHAHLRYLRAEV